LTNFNDRTLTCSNCKQQFTFKGSEQVLYMQKGLSDPSQCPFCRAARMIARGAAEPSRAAHTERAMYPATCTRCGRRTSVPFEPRSTRPVYCSDCYKERREEQGGYTRERSRSRGYGS
jgi:CxxC-x17-CxxC domain-containing protein